MSAVDTSFGVTLLWTLAATVIVAVVAWIALGLLRRVLQSGRPGGSSRSRAGGRRLRIVQSLPLGTRERAVLIEDGEREYLLGVAAGGVRLLASQPLGEFAPTEDHAASGSARDGPAANAPTAGAPPNGGAASGASARSKGPNTPPTHR